MRTSSDQGSYGALEPAQREPKSFQIEMLCKLKSWLFLEAQQRITIFVTL